jgi:hypothetical protein
MTMIVRLLAAMAALTLLAACAEEMGASAVQIAKARYESSEPPYIALVTTVARRNDRGAHTGLIINAGQRVLYDPAGTFTHPSLPERGDIHYGMDDRMVRYYKRFHARFSHYVHEQKVYVPMEVAELVLRRTQAEGAQPKMFCSNATGAILNGVPQFANVRSSFFPENLRRDFAEVPGVIDSYWYENDLVKAVPLADDVQDGEAAALTQ